MGVTIQFELEFQYHYLKICVSELTCCNAYLNPENIADREDALEQRN